MEAKNLQKALEDIKKNIEKAGPSIEAVQANMEAGRQLVELIAQVPEEYNAPLTRSAGMCLNIADEHLADIDVICGNVRKAAEGALTDAGDLPHAPTEEELRDIYREKSTNVSEKPPEEDKGEIIEMLAHVLKKTRAGGDIKYLTMENFGPWTAVAVTYESGYTERVDVTADSGVVMIIDICKAIM